jgi:hypothetical protein
VKSPRFKFLRSRFLWSWRGLALLAALVLMLFLFRPGVYKLRSRIAASIGNALGRRVGLDNVRLRLLPQPGFDLEGLVIYDDPAFSAEPMIRAQEVSAAIRFRSLLRGRLEIATLSATEPSINLVRNNQGRWNLASLLERNAQIPVAPTGKSSSEHRFAFPYLEASNARLNFKIGQTKKSFALMDADLALWQDSENSWGSRIKAQPVRTDFHLTDTGVLQINAAWQRAASLSSTPMQISVQWQKGQLGQITTLLSGKDRGWRGGVNLVAKLSGTPEALRIESQTVVEDFRRYDIVDRENVRLATGCSGVYDAITSKLNDLLCQAPVGDGTVRLSGTLTVDSQPAAYDLAFEAEKVPLASVVRLLRQVKQQIPQNLTATGLLNAEFHTTGNARVLESLTGSGAANDVRLSSDSAKDEVIFGTIPLTLVSAATPSKSRSARNGNARSLDKNAPEKEQEPAETHLKIGPFALAVNSSPPIDAGGWISTGGYQFSLRGDVELKDLFRLEDFLGLPVAHPAAEGAAKLDASISGPWQGFAPAGTSGSAQLHNVHAEMRGLNTPIEISSANVTLLPNAVLLQKLSARTGSTRWSGDVTAPRHCAAPNSVPGTVADVTPICMYQFDLTADQLSTADLAEWFTPQSTKRPWYRILNSDSNAAVDRTPLLAVRARGQLHVGRFGLKKVVVTQLATQVEVDRGKIVLNNLRAQLMQGTHQGNWTIDASNRDLPTSEAKTRALNPSVRYHGQGTLRDISLTQVATLMNDGWITGTADGTFNLDASGESFRDLLSRADGKVQFAMRNGSLPNIEIPGSSAPRTVRSFTGELLLKKGAWQLANARLESRDGAYNVSGNLSADNKADFVFKRGDERAWLLTGTLAKPLVTPANRNDVEHAAAKRDEPTAAKP